MKQPKRDIRRLALISWLFVLVTALTSPAANAQEELCTLSIQVLSEDGSEPIVPLQLVVLHSGGTKQTFDLAPRSGPVDLSAIDCTPVAAKVFLVPQPNHFGLYEPVRLTRQRHRFSEDKPVAQLTLRVPTLRKVICRVMDETGKPVAGGKADLRGDLRRDRRALSVGARIQQDGIGELWATPGEYELYYGNEWTSEFSPRSIDGVSTDSRTVTVGARDVEVEFVVPQPPSTHLVRGRVVDPDGEGLEGIRIFPKQQGMRGTQTDPDGRFSFRAKPDSVTLTLGAEDRTGRWVLSPASLDLTTERDEFVWKAAPWDGSKLTVRMVSSDTGEPLSRIGVSAQLGCLEDSPTRKFADQTGPSGEVQIPCADACPGMAYFDLSRSDHREYFLPDGSQAIPADLCDSTLEIRLNRGASLTATIQDPDGFPVVDLPITLDDPAGRHVARGKTDDDGSYRFQPLNPGRYRVQIDSFQGSESESTLILGDGFESNYYELRNTDQVETRLTATIGGRICLESIEAAGTEDKLSPRWMIVASAAPDASARAKRTFHLRNRSELSCTSGLAPGAYRVLAVSEDPQAFAPAWSPTMSIADLETHTVAAGESTIISSLSGGTFGGGLLIDLARFPIGLPVLMELEISVADGSGKSFGPWVKVPQERILYSQVPEGEFGAMIAALIPQGRYKVRLRIQGEDEAEATEWFLRGSTLLDSEAGVSVTLEEKL